jgi:hypothetical protein
LREKALEDRNPSLGWLEWSAHPTLPIDSITAWKQANPALGHTIELETLRHRITSGEPSAVRTEMLCQFVSNLASPWPPQAFEKCGSDSMVFEPGPQTFFALDVSPSRRNASLVAAQNENGKVKLKLLHSWNSDTAIDDFRIASEVSQFALTYRPRVVCFDRYTSANIAQRLQHGGIQIFEISGQVFSQACDEMLQAMTHDRLLHGNEVELVEAVNNAAMKTNDSGWRIVRRKSAGEVTAAVASAMAIWYANKPQATALIVV